ncbi:hypothetical protein OGAPHI_002776 [Ogataea philodendri]|uniref:Anaphase-promoting complex subunit 11 RING-H2 finger domain-containing protein n=1 Tax=Ogataea philodendri TaxID=1378263 RepID=A0A9P8P869_9ASCO|nr:uncharacterized protein OGAPHI_002776 [Ogataea philodendri]KAH3667127.1 hypothetical protein OGAPHI_002776 [Ogataea philodendri]
MADQMDVDLPAPAAQQQKKKRFEVKKWTAVAFWTWDQNNETCAICRNHLMEPCIDCETTLSDGSTSNESYRLDRGSGSSIDPYNVFELGESVDLRHSCAATPTDPTISSTNTVAIHEIELNRYTNFQDAIVATNIASVSPRICVWAGCLVDGHHLFHRARSRRDGARGENKPVPVGQIKLGCLAGGATTALPPLQEHREQDDTQQRPQHHKGGVFRIGLVHGGDYVVGDVEKRARHAQQVGRVRHGPYSHDRRHGKHGRVDQLCNLTEKHLDKQSGADTFLFRCGHHEISVR